MEEHVVSHGSCVQYSYHGHVALQPHLSLILCGLVHVDVPNNPHCSIKKKLHGFISSQISQQKLLCSWNHFNLYVTWYIYAYDIWCWKPVHPFCCLFKLFFFYYTGFVLCCFTSFCFHLFLFLFHCIILPLCKSVWFCSLHNTFFFALCVMCLKYSLQIVHNSQNQEDWDSVFMLWVVFSTWSVFVLTGKFRLCVWF